MMNILLQTPYDMKEFSTKFQEFSEAYSESSKFSNWTALFSWLKPVQVQFLQEIGPREKS